MHKSKLVSIENGCINTSNLNDFSSTLLSTNISTTFF